MYEYRGPERDQFAETYMRISGGRTILFWIAWVAATYFGFVLGERWGGALQATLTPPDPASVQLLSLEQSVYSGNAVSYLAAFAGALVAGGVLALAQSVFMFPFLRLSGAK